MNGRTPTRMGHRIADDAFTVCALISLGVGPYLLVSAIAHVQAPEWVQVGMGLSAIAATAMGAERLPHAARAAWRTLVEEWNDLAEDDGAFVPEQPTRLWHQPPPQVDPDA